MLPPSPLVGERVKGEKRPRLPKREVQDMLRRRRKRKVVRASRSELFSSEVRLARKSVRCVRLLVYHVIG